MFDDTTECGIELVAWPKSNILYKERGKEGGVKNNLSRCACFVVLN